MTATSGKALFNLLPNPSTNAVTPRDTSNRNPREAMIPKDSNLVSNNFAIPSFGFAFRPQMSLIESWISPNTVVEPMSKVMIPMVAAIPPFPLIDAFLMICSICLAASLPTKPEGDDILYPPQLLYPGRSYKGK
jgi:hypothetical protein